MDPKWIPISPVSVFAGLLRESAGIACAAVLGFETESQRGC